MVMMMLIKDYGGGSLKYCVIMTNVYLRKQTRFFLSVYCSPLIIKETKDDFNVNLADEGGECSKQSNPTYIYGWEPNLCKLVMKV